MCSWQTEAGGPRSPQAKRAGDGKKPISYPERLRSGTLESRDDEGGGQGTPGMVHTLRVGGGVRSHQLPSSFQFLCKEAQTRQREASHLERVHTFPGHLVTRQIQIP